MEANSYKTIHVNKQSADRKWVVVDAENAVLGRLTSQIAKILMGKHKPSYSPHVECGDNVIVLNCGKVKLTGKKMTDKIYISHTGYPGGQRENTPVRMLAKKPHAVIEKAVKGMLPKNRLGRQLFRNLYVYEGTEHPHEAQQPTVVKF